MKALSLSLRVLLAAAILAGVAASASATFMYDLKFDDGTKAKTVQPNTTYTLDLWAIITGADTNLANDAWVDGWVRVDPAKVGAGAIYNPGNSTSVGITGAALWIAFSRCRALQAPRIQKSPFPIM